MIYVDVNNRWSVLKLRITNTLIHISEDFLIMKKILECQELYKTPTIARFFWGLRTLITLWLLPKIATIKISEALKIFFSAMRQQCSWEVQGDRCWLLIKRKEKEIEGKKISGSCNKFITLNQSTGNILACDPCKKIETAEMDKINKNVNIFQVKNNLKEFLISVFSTLWWISYLKAHWEDWVLKIL